MILLLSFGFNNQSLVQNFAYAQFNDNKIEISADNPPIPSYLKHSKKAQQKTLKTPKKETFQATFTKMLKSLFLAVALFLAFIALVVKNKDKFKWQAQHSEDAEIKKDENNAQPEIITVDQQVRNLVFEFFKMNKP